MINALEGGGAEKVLTNVVKNLNHELFDITVYTINELGIYIDEIKKHAKYYSVFHTKASTQEEKVKFQQENIYHLSLSPVELRKFVINENYDIEVAFLEDSTTRLIASSQNPNSYKIAWVHTDMTKNRGALSLYKNLDEQRQVYNQFNQIICVSNTAKDSFNSLFGLKDKVRVCFNPIDRNEIIKKSEELVDDFSFSSKFKVVSVGRLVNEKGYNRLLSAHKVLIEQGFDYELIIIGEGPLRYAYEEFINENNLEDSVKLIGFKSNPHKYMRQCNLFICSSVVEGLSSVVIEALILGIPVIATDCGGMYDILGDNEYGKIVEDSVQGIYEGLYKILTNTIEYEKYKQASISRGKFFDLNERMEEIENILLK